MDIIAMAKRFLVGAAAGLLIVAHIPVYADPVAPTDPKAQAIQALPTGAIGIQVEWDKVIEEGTPVMPVDQGGYLVYYGPTATDTTRIAGMGWFTDIGARRQMTINDAMCTLALQRAPQDVCFRLIAYTGAAKSAYSDAACLSLSATDVAGVCRPLGVRVIVGP